MRRLQTVPLIDAGKRDDRRGHALAADRACRDHHLTPLVVFITLIQLMDNFRVFEPIVGFNAEQRHLAVLDHLQRSSQSDGTCFTGPPPRTSMLTIVGVCILLAPVIVRTWRANRRAA